MTARPHPDEFAIDDFLAQQNRKSLLRFIACGSVDHGKSTLIGRLLYEAKLRFDDQLEALAAESRKHGTQGKELDFSLLLDGLAAEREQKITIDVAYRFFATERRKFIVADAPGHEQYTRNMATGASTADLALIVVNAQSGFTRQTRRHSLIVTTLGVRRLVLAVNKMDLVDWSEESFRAIESEFRRFAGALGVSDIVCIPISARRGDNIAHGSAAMGWYRGPTLLSCLEEVEVGPEPRAATFRMPVQLVNRPDPDFRGYSGTIASGDVYVGMPVRVWPSGQTSQIDRIVTYDGELERADTGRSVTVTLADEIDASRGDVIADAGQAPLVAERLQARVVWVGKEPLTGGHSYLIKLGTCSAKATLEAPLHVLDLDTGLSNATEKLFINDIGDCTLRLDRTVAADLYSKSKETGSFILIDPESYDTIGMGFVEGAGARAGLLGRLRQRLALMQRTGAKTASTSAGESHVRSIVKAISWRATGSLDTFLLTLLITGSSVFAGSVAVTEIATKIAFYYGHERIWALIPWGRE